jgi:hypothetical protein
MDTRLRAAHSPGEEEDYLIGYRDRGSRGSPEEVVPHREGSPRVVLVPGDIPSVQA